MSRLESIGRNMSALQTKRYVPTDSESEYEHGLTDALAKPVSSAEQAQRAEAAKRRKTAIAEATRRAKRRRDIINALRTFMRGFGLGWGARMVLLVLPKLIRYVMGHKSESLLMLIRNCLTDTIPIKYGLFLGQLMGSFVAMSKFSKPWRHVLSSRTRALLTGSVAGLSLVWLPRESQEMIMLFFLVRSLEICGRKLHEKGYAPDFAHYDVVVMSVASAQCLWAWLYMPESLDRSYLNFLWVHGAKPRALRDMTIEMLNHNPLSTPTAATVAKMRAAHVKLGFDPANVIEGSANVWCQMSHPESSSCSIAFWKFWLGGIRRALPVYLPVMAIPLFVFNSKKLFANPTTVLSTTVFNIVRSSVFLSSYCSMAWTTVCIVRALGYSGRRMVNVSGLVAGTAVLIEKKSRRIELGLYVLSHAIRSLWKCWNAWGYVPVIPHSEVVLFMFCTATFGHAYLNAPHMMRRSYLGLFNYLFPGMARRTDGRRFRVTKDKKEVEVGRRHGRRSGDSNGDDVDDDDEGGDSSSSSSSIQPSPGPPTVSKRY